VLVGLSGPIKVNGGDFNSLMPPPPGLDDDKIAAVLTYVRSHFGNQGAAITKDQVATVRAALSGRTNSWSSDELSKLRPAGGDTDAKGAAPATPAGATPGAAAAPAAAAQGAAPQAAPTNAQPTGKQP
jgi:hypothetical protein